MGKKRGVAILGAFLLLAVGVSLAANTGTVIIKTTEKSGGAMPGVVVELTNVKGLSVPAPKRTDGSGTANFLLTAGSGYTVKITMPGFQPQTQDFDIGLGKSKTILFQMAEQRVEKVTVKARVVELDEGGENKVAFSDNFIEDLPILGRNYQNVLTLAPGVNDSNNDGNPNIHGSRETDFKATIDGVSNVDPLTGTFMANINPDAIEDIEIVTTGASAEYGGAVGGFGKIVTKQGSNAFDGNTSLYLRSSFFDGGTVNSGTDTPDVKYHDIRPTLNFTGPVVKDKLFFALFHEYIDRGEPLNLIGVGAANVVVTTRGSRNLDKLTWQVSPANKVVFQAQADPYRRGPLAVNALTDPQSGVDYKQGGPIYQIHWDAQASSVLSVQSLIGFSHGGISLEPITDGVKNSCGVDVEATIGNRLDPFGRPGGTPIDEDYCRETLTARRSGSFLERYSDDRIRYTLKSDASYFLENFLGISHTLKAGILAEKKRFSATDQYRPFSVFQEVRASFGGLDNIVGVGGGSLTRQVWIPGLPDAATNTADGSLFGFYLEDQFRPQSNVSLRVGFRVEQENMKAQGFEHFDPAEESRSFQQSYDQCVGNNGSPGNCARAYWRFFHRYESYPVIGNAQFKQILQDPRSFLQDRTVEKFRISNTNIAPRFSVSWDPGTNGKTKLFATAGRYYGETFLAIPAYEQPPDTFFFNYRVIADETTTQCRPNPDGDGTTCSTRPEIERDQSARVSPASIRQVDRNLRTPYQDEYTLGFQREIFQETSITVTAIRRKFRDQFQDIDVNHYAQDLGTVSTNGCIHRPSDGPLVPSDTRPDGVYDDCGGITRTVPGPPPFFRPRLIELPDGVPDLFVHNPFFNQVNLVGNFNETEYRAYQFEMKRRLHRNWELEGSYVWSKAVGQAEEYQSSLGDDPTTVQDEKGFLAFDQRHFVKVNLRTQLPLWNVRLSTAFNWQSGLPYSIVEQQVSFDGVRKFGPNSITYPQIRTTFPTHQRNDQRNDGYWLFDMGARKDFTVGKLNLETSLDIFNVLNNTPVIIDEVRNLTVIARRHVGRQYQIGAKVTF